MTEELKDKLLSYVIHPNFLSLERQGEKVYRIVLKSLIVEGRYWDITGERPLDTSYYMLDVYDDTSGEFAGSSASEYISKYLSIGNQHEDEDGGL